MKNPKIYLPLFIGLLLAFVAFFACNCPPALPLAQDADLRTAFKVNYNGFGSDLSLIFEFNRPVDSSSLLGNKTIYINDAGVQYTGSFRLSADHRYLFVEPCELFCSDQSGSCEFHLTFDGDNGDGMAIMSLEGEILDGDGDGSAGGDYVFANKTTNCNNYDLIVSNPPSGSSDTYEALGSSVFGIDIKFNERIDSNTVKPGVNIYFLCTGFNATKETGKVVWFGRDSLRFVADKTYGGLQDSCGLNNDGHYQLILEGGGAMPIKSVHGVPLQNGDYYYFDFWLY